MSLTDTAAGIFADYMQLPLGPQTALHNICKHTLICNTCGATLHVQLPNHTCKTIFNFNKLKQVLLENIKHQHENVLNCPFMNLGTDAH